MNKNQTILVVVSISIVAMLVGVSLMQMMANDGDEGKIRVVATFYPLAYFAEEIGGEHVSVKTLIPPGTEVHTWHPSTSDILAADKAQILIYNGAGLEPWFEEDILPSIKVEGKEIVDTTHGLELFENEESPLEHLLNEMDHIIHEWEDGVLTSEEALEAIEELIHEYMEYAHEDDHENEDEHEHDHGAEDLLEEMDHIIHEWEDGVLMSEEALEAIEELIHEYMEYAHEDEDEHEHGLYDPHTWVDPVLAKQQAHAVYEALKRVDPSNAEYYVARWNSLKQRFDSIHAEYASELADREHNAIFVTHDAYGYLARRYGFHQHTIIGIHADEEPGVATIARIADEMADYGIYTFFVQPLYPDSYAETIKTEVQRITGKTVTILTLYHMSNTVEGMNYFQQMEANLVNLKVGLGA